MDKRILKKILLFLLLNAFPNVISGSWFCNPTPPDCADDCNGNGYYISQDGTACIQCPQCPAGQELNKDCGNGLNEDAVCIPCREGFFSLSTSQRCTQCTTCTNTVEQEPCQLTQNRVCGDCLPGFVRTSDRFPTDFNACPDRCLDLPRDTLQCRDWWSNQEREPIEVDQPLDGFDPCEPEPPLCIDPCHGGNFFLDYDGLCKACLSCQPGEELNKVCGRGKNGDAYCRRCPEGTFSEDGLERCSPCRICVNTVATECTASRNTECGECLPGYYQDADGYFPDQGACPNKCPECPNIVPQCQEWCESRTNSDHVTVDHAESVGQDDVTPADVAADIFQSGADNEINDEANLPASHGSYMVIYTVLASLLAVVVIVLITVLFVFRYMWNRSNGSNASTTSLLPSPSGTPSPTSSPSRTPPTVYEPTTYPNSPEGDAWEFLKHLRTAYPRLTGSRPVSGGSTDAENESSAVSTPTLNLNRRLVDRDLLRHMLVRQVGVDHDDSLRSTPPHTLKHPDSVKEERMVNSAGSLNHAVSFHGKETYPTQSDRNPRPIEDIFWPRAPSSGKVVTERASGTVHPHVEDMDEVPVRMGLRRRSLGSIDNSEILKKLQNGHNGNTAVDAVPVGLRHCSPGSIDNSEILKKLQNGHNGNTAQLIEPEAAVSSTDSSRDDGPTTNVPEDTNNNKSANPKQLSRSLKPNVSSHTTLNDAAETKLTGYKGTLDVLPEETPVERKPATIPDDARSSGNKSPGDTNVTINISMTTKEIERFHIGDVHNKRNCHDCAHHGIKASEPHNDDDNGEAQKLLHVNIAASETDTLHVGDEGNKLTLGHGGSIDHDDDHDEDDGEGDKLLDTKSS